MNNRSSSFSSGSRFKRNNNNRRNNWYKNKNYKSNIVSKDFDPNNPLGNTIFNNIKTQQLKSTQKIETNANTNTKTKSKYDASTIVTNNKKGNVVYITDSNLEKKTQNKKKMKNLTKKLTKNGK